MDYPLNTIHISVGTIIKTVIIIALFYVAYLLKNLLLVLLLAIVIASAVSMIVKWFSRRGVPRLLSVILVYLVGASIFCWNDILHSSATPL